MSEVSDTPRGGEARGRVEEREACAKLMETFPWVLLDPDDTSKADVVQAIRSRQEEKP
jgi:hypothetical protein